MRKKTDVLCAEKGLSVVEVILAGALFVIVAILSSVY